MVRLGTAFAIIRDKGYDLTKADLTEIEAQMIVGFTVDEYREISPWVYEGLSLIVNDPLYRGDAPPIR